MQRKEEEEEKEEEDGGFDKRHASLRVHSANFHPAAAAAAVEAVNFNSSVLTLSFLHATPPQC